MPPRALSAHFRRSDPSAISLEPHWGTEGVLLPLGGTIYIGGISRPTRHHGHSAGRGGGREGAARHDSTCPDWNGWDGSSPDGILLRKSSRQGIRTLRIKQRDALGLVALCVSLAVGRRFAHPLLSGHHGDAAAAAALSSPVGRSDRRVACLHLPCPVGDRRNGALLFCEHAGCWCWEGRPSNDPKGRTK
jgi:hypothetical protein